MSVTEHRVLAGRYCDSLVLMQLHAALESLAGIEEAAAVMATEANREILEARSLWPAEGGTRPHDLLVVVRAADAAAAAAALDRVDEMLRRRDEATTSEYLYRGLATALRERPDARWVAVSVPGEHAAAVADEALDSGRHVFLYSDNVPVAREVELKRKAARRGLLVLGPDCGTARIGGVGLGFANRVRRGRIGLVGASGTGLQAVSCRIDELAAAERGEVGVSQIVGTGGRDLSEAVGASASLRALDLLGRDPETEVIVLVSKPPAAQVAARVVEQAGRVGKPVVVCLVGGGSEGAGAATGGQGGEPPSPAGVHRVRGLERAAELAVVLARRARADAPSEGSTAAGGGKATDPAGKLSDARFAAAGAAAAAPAAGEAADSPEGCLRGLFSGGTLALETAVALRDRGVDLATNVGLAGSRAVEDPGYLDGHCIVDLGADELTRGRPHPMIDPALRDRWLRREAADPSVGVVLVDVVLGDGAHADPAAGLAPAITGALREAAEAGRDLEVIVLLIGAEADPQDPADQTHRLRDAGAVVTRSVAEGLERVASLWLGSPRASRGPTSSAQAGAGSVATAAEAIERSAEPTLESLPVPLDALDPPTVVNVGLDHFADSLAAQAADVVRVDWRPPAGGDARLAGILGRMKRAD